MAQDFDSAPRKKKKKGSPSYTDMRDLANQIVTEAQRARAKAGKKPDPFKGAQLTQELMVVGDTRSRFMQSGMIRDEFDPPDRVISKNTVLSYQLYQRMLDDPIVEASVNLKKYRALAPGTSILTSGTEEVDVRNREFVELGIEQIEQGLDMILYCQLDALDMGFAIAEVTYEVIKEGPFAGKLGIKSIKAKDPSAIGFKLDDFNNIIAIKHKLRRELEFPVNKFWIFSWMPRYSSPWGRSELRTAYRAWFIKNTAWKLHALNLERKVTPPLVGRVPEGTATSIKQDFAEVLEELQHNSVLVLDDNLVFEAIDIAGQSKDVFLESIERLNREIIVGIQGSFLAQVDSQSTGSRAASLTHADTNELFVRSLRAQLAESFTKQVIERWVRLNFLDGEIPFIQFNDDDVESVEQRRETDKLFLENGVPLGENYFYEAYGRPKPEEGEAVVEGSPAATPLGFESPEDKTGLLDRIQEPSLFQEQDIDSMFFREPDEFEEKADIRRTARFIIQNEQITLDQMAEAYRKIFRQIDNLLKPVFTKSGIKQQKYDDTAVNMNPIKRVIRDADFNARAFGFGEVFRFIQKQKLGTKGREAGLEISAKTTGFKLEQFTDEFQDLGDIFGAAPEAAVIAALKAQVPMRPKTFQQVIKKMQSFADQQAFSVAGLEKAGIVRDVHQLLTQAVVNNWSEERFKQELDRAKIKYIKPVFGKAGDVGDKILDFHASTIYRTTINRAMNMARLQAFEDPIVRDLVPGMEYSAILDGRTTAFCRKWDGFKARSDDAIWQDLTPPNHFNCRSTLVPIDFIDWNPRKASRKPRGVNPQEGFGNIGGQPFEDAQRS